MNATRLFAQLFSVGLFLVIFSCDKSPGYGGNAGITGVVKLRRYNSDYTVLKQETVYQNADVYIVFNDGEGYGDKVKTSYDGSFNFNHLVPGNYKIYVYSNDTTMVSTGQIPVMVDAKISKRKELVNVGVIKVADNKALTGNASITGKVIASKLGASYAAIHEKVYMTDMTDSMNTNYVFTDYNGVYVFDNLPIGNYKVYVYSRNLNVPATPPYLLIDTIVNVVKNNDKLKFIDFNIND
jgi:hypothetical protein